MFIDMTTSSMTTKRSAIIAAASILLAIQSLDNILPAVIASATCITEQNVCNNVTEVATYRPLPLCKEYALCTNGQVSQLLNCPEGYKFDTAMQSCNGENGTNCSVAETCSPTPYPTALQTNVPTVATSALPSTTTSSLPSTTDTDIPSFYPSYIPSTSPTFPDYNEMFFQFLESEDVKEGMKWTVFQAHNSPDGIPYPTTRYSYDGLVTSLREMSGDGITSDGRSFVFYTGQDVRRIEYGLANLAAFLANVMVESLGYDTCDEFNTDTDIFHFGRYPLSNACGQNQRSYQDEVCTTTSTTTDTNSRSEAETFAEQKEVDMSCSVDPEMEMEAMGFSSAMTGVLTPPPFTCRPKANTTDYAGYWDDKTGETYAMEYSNSINRTDVEGCCWWGRGVLLTRGVCNIGKLNYYLGKRASEERGEGRFPNTDFCSSPEAICSDGKGGESAEDIKWIVGMFEWIERVQTYKDWDYMINLQNFVDGGSWDDSFIDAVSSIFTQGCHSSYCSSTMEATNVDERRENFVKLLEIFRYSEPTKSPVLPPTQPSIPSAPQSSTNSNNAGMPSRPSTEIAYTPSISVPQQWEFDPTIPTTQQWNGNSPIQLTPTWALEYYGNPPAQAIPTLDGYNPTTQQWNANPPAELAPLWEGQVPSATITQQWEFDPAFPTTQQWNGNSPIQLTPTWALEYYGNPPAQAIPTLDGYNPTTQQWNANAPAQLAPVFWALPSMEKYAPSVAITQQWEFDPTIPTTQQWNGNSPIQLTPTWAVEYYGNPPAQIIPTLDGYNSTTQKWNANPPAQLAPLWEGTAPSQPTSQQGNGNSFPTVQQGNVPSVPTTQGWNGDSPTQFASRPEGSDAVTPSSQLTSDATHPTTATLSQGGGTSSKDTLIPMEDSSALLLPPAACWLTSLALCILVLLRI